MAKMQRLFLDLVEKHFWKRQGFWEQRKKKKIDETNRMKSASCRNETQEGHSIPFYLENYVK